MAKDITSSPPKVLFFDVFGTVVDWRRTVVAHLASRCQQSLASSASVSAASRSTAERACWASFAQDWRTSYAKFTASYDNSDSQYKTIDEHHYDSLKDLIKQYGLEGLWSEEEVESISKIWHFLDPWPDSTPGLAALNEMGFKTSTLSNGNMSLLIDLCKHVPLPFSTLTSAEEFGAYKPHKSVYLGACKKMGFEAAECGLVAAHLKDLEAARGCGLRSFYVERMSEETWSEQEVQEAKDKGWVDMWVEKDEGVGGLLEMVKRFQQAI